MNFMLNRWLPGSFALLFGLLFVLPASAVTVNSFHIGSSLTWDSQPLGIAAIAQDYGFDHTAGHHIRCSGSLNAIVGDPTDTCVAPVTEFGTYNEALPNHQWDAVTMESHRSRSFSSTLLSDATSILSIIDTALANPANSDTTFYIYSAWPRLEFFETVWTSSVPDVDSTPTKDAREYIEHLVNRVLAATNEKVALIPVGEVLYELDQRMEAGLIPGFTDIGDFFRNDIHLKGDLGRYTVGVTVFATMYGINPTGSTKPDGFYGSESAYTPDIYEAIHDAVWDVVSGNPNAISIFSPADFQPDGLVDNVDLSVWAEAFGVDALGDTDRDIDTDGADFLTWQREFQENPPLLVNSVSKAIVPEPSSGLLVLILCGKWLASRNSK